MKRIALALCAVLITSSLAADTPVPDKPPNLGWLVGASSTNGKFVVLKVRNEIPAGVTPAQYPNVIEVHWKYTPDSQGMPAEAVILQMIKLDAALDPIQGDRLGFLMMTVTGNGERTWIWYVADSKAFGAALNRFIPGHPFPITVNTDVSEPDWKTYRVARGRVK